MRRLMILVPLVVAATLAGLGVAPAAPPAGGEKLALIIGVDNFQGETRPNSGALGDSEEMRQVLVRAGFPDGNIKMLTDEAATADGIRDGLSWLAGRSKENSFSVVAYSGHVKQVGSTEYIWPHDNQHIPDTELASSLRQVKGWMWLHIAGCEAAGFDEGLSGPKRLITASSESYEKSYELPPESRNSVFTNLLVDKGMLRKLADGNRDGKVSIQEAFQYAADRAPDITAGQEQGAQHPVMAGGDGSDWFLDLPPAPAPLAAPRCFLFFFCV